MRKVLFITALLFVHEASYAMERVSKKQRTCCQRIWAWQMQPKLNTKLMQAAEKNDSHGINELLQQGAQIESIGLRCETPLERALLKGKWNAVRCLMAHGATLPRLLYLYEAVKLECPAELQKKLIDTYAPPSGHELQLAVQKREIKLVQFFLDLGADPNWQDENGKTALWHTTHPEILRTLRRAGAQLSAQGAEHGDTLVFPPTLSRVVQEALITAPYLTTQPFKKEELAIIPNCVFALLCSLQRIGKCYRFHVPQGIKWRLLTTCFGQKLYFVPLGKFLCTINKRELVKKMPFALQKRLIDKIIPSGQVLIELHTASHLAQLQDTFSIKDAQGKQAWQYGPCNQLCPESESIKAHWQEKITQEYAALFPEALNE